ncbi:hypothetical protein CDO46_01795 [Pigmentiphaga sp. NML030171]|nr:hypothetical protein CDO46_01795 [Pigmentiphaga sp. NML030171]
MGDSLTRRRPPRFLRHFYTRPPKLYPVFTPVSLRWQASGMGTNKPPPPIVESASAGKNGSHLPVGPGRHRARDHRADSVLRGAVARRNAMTWLHLAGAVAAAALFVYLLVALFKAEKF